MIQIYTISIKRTIFFFFDIKFKAIYENQHQKDTKQHNIITYPNHKPTLIKYKY